MHYSIYFGGAYCGLIWAESEGGARRWADMDGHHLPEDYTAEAASR